MKYIGSLIDHQVRQWDLSQRAAETGHKKALSFMPVITISHSPGARGQEIAEALARRTGFHLFDRELIDSIANDIGVQTKIIEMLDESARSELEAWFDGMLRGRIVDSSDYLRSLSRTLGAISRHGRGIIIGRGANIILGISGGAHFRITGSEAMRIKRIVERKKISLKEAKELAAGIQARQRIFVSRSFGVDVDNPAIYDLELNTDYLEVPDAVDIIMLEYARKRENIIALHKN